jgi:hypothetical protein
LLLVAIAIGVINAVAFVVFEHAVNDGSEWVWNDFAGTDDERWRVVPLAIVLSIGFSLLLRLTHQQRYQEPNTDLLAEGAPQPPATLATIAVIFLVGVASLVAGASLGPKHH